MGLILRTDYLFDSHKKEDKGIFTSFGKADISKFDSEHLMWNYIRLVYHNI